MEEDFSVIVELTLYWDQKESFSCFGIFHFVP
jgi:hypothetical protein